jgi:hypothetical protein
LLPPLILDLRKRHPNALIGQHRVSTFKVLVRRLRGMRCRIFADEEASVEYFWKELFLEMDDDTWGKPYAIPTKLSSQNLAGFWTSSAVGRYLLKPVVL